MRFQKISWRNSYETYKRNSWRNFRKKNWRNFFKNISEEISEEKFQMNSWKKDWRDFCREIVEKPLGKFRKEFLFEFLNEVFGDFLQIPRKNFWRILWRNTCRNFWSNHCRNLFLYDIFPFPMGFLRAILGGILEEFLKKSLDALPKKSQEYFVERFWINLWSMPD